MWTVTCCHLSNELELIKFVATVTCCHLSDDLEIVCLTGNARCLLIEKR